MTRQLHAAFFNLKLGVIRAAPFSGHSFNALPCIISETATP
jgi:hypothetical protein